MKGKYTILDREYQHAMIIFTRELTQKSIDYTVIGGGAVQIHIANATKNPEALHSKLRKTGDIDIVVDAPLEEMILLFNELTSQGEASNREPGRAFIGPVSVNYLPEGYLHGFDHQFALSETELKNLRGTQVKVQVPEVCIAAKLTGSFKNKDITDIRALHRELGENLDESKIRHALSLLGKEEKMDVYHGLTRNDQ